jgi:hypothetical protein
VWTLLGAWALFSPAVKTWLELKNTVALPIALLFRGSVAIQAERAKELVR